MAKRKTARARGPRSQDGRFAYDGLDRVIHEKARLGIISSLAAHQEGLLFNDLKQLCALSDGNLSRHLAVLVDAKFVEARRGKAISRPQTRYRLTATGRSRFLQYLRVLESIVADAQSAQPPSRRKPGAAIDGWATT